MTSLDARLQRMLEQQEIRDVVYRYCRGIDRRDFALVRSCYHDDATDDHGDFRGDADGFIGYVTERLQRYTSTMHFIGNVLVEPDGDMARCESYVVAYHRIAARGDRGERDFTVGLRYVDDFSRRDGEWRIAARVCAIEWSRVDPVVGSWAPTAQTTVGRHGQADVVWAPSIATWRP